MKRSWSGAKERNGNCRKLLKPYCGEWQSYGIETKKRTKHVKQLLQLLHLNAVQRMQRMQSFFVKKKRDAIRLIDRHVVAARYGPDDPPGEYPFSQLKNGDKMAEQSFL